ncbi:hypothetical protein CK203_033101 [Vitis vinifera]|uniref:J domain-containing protein n=1 Tax=Vitis vinifera TaxID=29760 RepID=A0A438G091_VITVI|nr:hypothetical protein CK203_033101 [Vitis vinifera]
MLLLFPLPFFFFPLLFYSQICAVTVLSDPAKRREYDKRKGLLHVYDYNMIEYLDRNKGLILTCNGLGIRHSIW